MDKLLKLLSENSAYTTDQLALMLNEPEDYIKAQIKEYEESGVIRGYQAMVNWDSVPDAGCQWLLHSGRPETEGWSTVRFHYERHRRTVPGAQYLHLYR